MNYEVDFSANREDDAWDAFLATTPGSHPEQTSAWAYAKALDGWQALRIRIHRDERIIGGTQLLYHRIPALGFLGYVPRGPCLATEDTEVATLAIREIVSAARRANVLYLVIDPPYSGQAMIPHLTAAGFRPSPDGFPPATMMDATILIDLAKPVEQLHARMRHATRKNIRKNADSVHVREGDEQDLNTIFQLMLDTCRRRGESPVPGTIEVFERLWHALRPRGRIHILISECQGDPVCAVLSFVLGDCVRTWKFGRSDLHTKCSASEILHWQLIQWAKRQGYRYVDLWQADPEVVKVLSSHQQPIPEAIKQRRLFGPTQHKMAYGGDLVMLPRPYCIFPNPVLNTAYAMLGAPLLKNRHVASIAGRALRRFWRKQGS